MTSSRVLTNRQLVRAAGVVLLGFLASGVLGLVRTAVFSSTFGAGPELDAFIAAQRIPELLFTLVAGGALGSSFIPVFARHLAANDKETAWKLASAVMTFSALAAALLALIIALLAPVIMRELLLRGRTPEEQALTTSLSQMMLVTTIIFSISGLLMGILNAHQLFLLPALALSMNNLGQIFGALVITRIIPHADGLGQVGNANIYGLAWGAILGAVLHLLIQLPGLPRVRARLRLLLDWRVPGVQQVLLLMGPRVLGLAVVQINFAVNIAFASGMIVGSLVALNTAWILMFFALGIIAQSVGTAVFPSLAALAASGDLDGFRDRLSSAMRGVLFLALPATIGLIVLGRPVVATIFQRGEWTPVDSSATAWALGVYALGICGHALLEVLSRAFYALSDTWTPVSIGLASMVSNIVLSLIFIQFIGDPDSLARGPFAGLALANSLTTLLEGAALWWLMRRRIGGLNDRVIINGAVRMLAAALIMGAVVVLAVGVLGDSSSVIKTIVGGAVGVAIFFSAAYALQIDEVRSLPRMVLRRR